ncbi:MAG: TrmB family transcriptional regulator [Thermoprotei archaeon]
MSSDLLEGLIERVAPYAKAFGVSKVEIKVYVTLLLNGPLTGRELATRVGMSQVKVYPVLKGLVEKGWVRKTLERPSRFEAVPLLEVWGSLKKRVYDALEGIERDIILPLNAFLSTKPSAQTVGIVTGRAVVEALKGVIYRASRQLDIALAHKELVVDDLVSAIEEASKRVRVRVLTSEDVKVELPTRVEVKTRTGMFGSGAISEDAIALVIRTGNALSAMLSNHDYFVTIGRFYFDHLWETA